MKRSRSAKLQSPPEPAVWPSARTHETNGIVPLRWIKGRQGAVKIGYSGPISLKYGPRNASVLLRAGGWTPIAHWTDHERRSRDFAWNLALTTALMLETALTGIQGTAAGVGIVRPSPRSSRYRPRNWRARRTDVWPSRQAPLANW
jgi:hypothetical protein